MGRGIAQDQGARTGSSCRTTLVHAFLAAASVLLLPLVAAPVFPAQAANVDKDQTRCTSITARQEEAQGIPRFLLTRIAIVESGRHEPGQGMRQPWPWTINWEGNAEYLATKDAAVARVRHLLATGVTSVDVGCMQVNLQYHPDAFADLDEAFEPRTNVAYAAHFLRSLYAASGSWDTAAAFYHSQTPALAAAYIVRLNQAKREASAVAPVLPDPFGILGQWMAAAPQHSSQGVENAADPDEQAVRIARIWRIAPELR
jgi:hypothetical protein